MRKLILSASLAAALVGCGPEFKGEAEFIFRASEVRKALVGKPARIRLHEKVSWTMSNAYERASFGGGKFTNQLDVVKHFAKDGNLFPLREFYTKDKSEVGELTNDVARLSVEEIPGQSPVLRMEADIAVWLSQTNVLERALCERKVNELLMLVISSESGELRYADFEKHSHVNPRQFAYAMIGLHQYCMFADLFGDEKESGLTMVSAYAALPAFPQYISDHFCTIIGDCDEPLVVEAENAVVDGQRHNTFKTTVKRGETLRVKCDKGSNSVGIRFHRMHFKERHKA